MCLLISGDVNFVDYEMSEFRDDITDIAAILYHREMLEIIGEKIDPPRVAFTNTIIWELGVDK